MYYTLRAVALIGVVAILSGRAGAQGVVMQRTISLNMAKTIAEATLAECKSKGYNTAVAVVDRRTSTRHDARRKRKRAASGNGAAQGLHRPDVPDEHIGISEAHHGSEVCSTARYRRHSSSGRRSADSDRKRRYWCRGKFRFDPRTG